MLLALSPERHFDEQESALLANHIEPYFTRLASYWEKGQYVDLVENYQALPQIFALDIRLCVYYLYAMWASKPETGLASCINALHCLLKHPQLPWRFCIHETQPDAAQSQSANALQNSLHLLFRKILHRMARQDAASSDLATNVSTPTGAVSAVDRANLGHTTEALARLTDLLTLRYPQLNAAFFGLVAQVSDYCRESEQRARTHDEAIEPQTGNGEYLDPAVEPLTPPGPPSTATEVSLTPTASAPLQQLLQHMHLFEQLCRQDDRLKAAVLLSELQARFERFDPLLYFPELFTDFIAQRATHAHRLEPYFSDRDSFQWQVLKDCLYVNPSAYLELRFSPPEPANTSHVGSASETAHALGHMNN
jgi:hypothetical protein